MFDMIKILPLLLVLGGGAYGYHNLKMAENAATIAQLQQNNDRLKTNNTRLEDNFNKAKSELERAEENLRVQLKAVGEMTGRLAAVQTERDEYLSIFRRHDLTKLARVKPGLIEPRINKGTADVFRQIEEDSREVADADS